LRFLGDGRAPDGCILVILLEEVPKGAHVEPELVH
jgi:hypothetical protein